jgi:hypothetical protein
VSGILIALAAGAYAANKQVNYLLDRLTGFKPPDFKPEYIAQHLQKANQALEVQKGITDEIQKQIELYNSAAQSADRVAEATRRHYEHLRRMNELSNAPESVKAQQRVKIASDERAAEIANKETEKANLESEGRTNQQKATGILTSVNSKQQDEEIVKKNKAYLDAADKALADLDQFKNKGNASGVSKDQLFKAYNNLTDSGVSSGDLDAADKKLRQDRRGYETAYRNSVDRSAANDETRARGEGFSKQAAKSFSAAANIGMALPAMKANAAQANADEGEESSAQAEEKSLKKKDGTRGGGGHNISQTEWEKAGVGMGPSVHIDIAKQQLSALQKIIQNTKPRSGGNHDSSHKQGVDYGDGLGART